MIFLDLSGMIKQMGTRKVSISLIDQQISRVSLNNLSVSELPETPEMCEMIDNVEQVLLENDEYGENVWNEINSIVDEIDVEYLQNMIFS
jgi:hypothetical protein